MMEMLRQSVGGWVAKIFIGLLVASFAVWGVSDAFLGGQQTTVVQAGETKVGALEYQLAYDGQINALSRQFGRRLTRDQARGFGVEANVLSQLVSGAILEENARQMGLGLSEERLAKQIGDDPAFRDASGRFSRSQLSATLRSIGMRESEYIATRQASAIRDQIVQGVSSDTKIPETFFDAMKQYQSEKRTFKYVLVGSDLVTDVPEPTDSEISAFYAENTATYEAPEYRKLTVVKLEAVDIADEASISEEDLKAAYEAGKASFSEPEERRILQLVIADKEKAQAYADRLAAGESFETIVQEEGKTLQGAELGMFSKANVPDQAIAETAFNLELNKPSGVVDGLFGSLILMVTEIKPETVTSFEEVKDQLRKDLALTNAARELFDVHDKLEDERGAGSSLTDAATKVGLKPRVIEAIDRSGLDKEGNIIADLPQSQQLIEQAFSIDQGIEAAPLSIGSDGFVWYEVDDIIDQRQKPLDEVREQVKEAWTAAETNRRVEEIANKIKEAADGGRTLEEATREVLSLAEDAASPVKESAPLLRSDSSDDLPSEAVSAGFSTKEGGNVVTPTTNGTYAVLHVETIDNSTGSLATNIVEQMNSQAQNDLLLQLITDLETQTEVTINQTAIDTIFAQQRR